MRRLLTILLLSATCLSASAQRFVKVFDSVTALTAANPFDVHTNAFVAGLTNVSIYTWVSSSTDTTNANLSVLKANNFATGRWFLHGSGGGAGITNYFETIYVTNLTVLSTNTYLTNFVFNNTYITNINQGTSDNWVAEGTTNSTLPGIGKPWKLQVTNSVEVGQAGEAGYVQLSSTNGTYTATISLLPDGTLVTTNNGGLVDTLALASLYGGTGTRAKMDDGTYKEITSPPGAVATNININPTDNRVPQRLNSTTFGDTALGTSSANLVVYSNSTVTTTFKTNGDVYLNRHVRVGPDFDNYGTSLFNSGWGFGASSSASIDALGRATMAVAAIDSSSFNSYGLIEGNVRHNSGTITNAQFVVDVTIPSLQYQWYLYADANTTNQEFRFERVGTGGGYPVRYRPLSVLAPAAIIGSGVTSAGDIVQFHHNYTNYVTLGPTGVITLGPGTTNVLYRNGTDLIYTNGATSVAFTVARGDGQTMSIGLATSGAGNLDSSFGVINIADPLTVSGNIVPNTSVTYDIGLIDAGASKWRRMVASDFYVHGTDDGSGNSTRLHQSFAATTNGAIYNVEANGTGVFRNQTFQIGGTNVMLLVPNNGWSGTGTKALFDDGTFKTTSAVGTITNYVTVALSNPNTAVTTGNTNFWIAPEAVTIKTVTAHLFVPSSSGSVTLELKKNGTTVLSAPVSLTSGTTNATASLSVTAVSAFDRLAGEITAAGTTAYGAQLKIGYTTP